MKSSTFALLLSSSLSNPCLGFSPSKMNAVMNSIKNNKSKHSHSSSSTQLQSTVMNADDEDAMAIMMDANSCANSDSCSIEDAEKYLNEMLHLQSDCVSGALQSDLICNDVIFPSEVIAGLRDKIQKEVESSSSQGRVLKFGINPIFLAVLAIYVSTGLLSLVHNNPDSFTMQEWMYALQGGFLDDMLAQYIKYGGLAPLDTASIINESSTSALGVVVPLTLQEWSWSIRDGYVAKLMSEYQTYGGLMTFVDMNDDSTILTTPFTTQEWMNAAKDGYLGDMIQHYIRNGGL